MFSVNLSLLSYTGLSIGPSVTGIGVIGPGRQSAPGTADELVVPWHDAQVNPSMDSLLSWRTRLSAFAGRDRELAELREWAASSPSISVKFVTGSAGVGKSRLAAELAAVLHDMGWAGGFVSLRKPRAFAMKAQGTLIVIDYPEEHPEGIREFLMDLAELGSAHRIRVLFLTRHGIGDWAGTISESRSVDLVDMRPIELGRLDDNAAYELFCSAQERAAELLQNTPLPVSKEDFAEWLWREPENYRALFVVAAALQSAIDPSANVFGYKGAEVIRALAEREISRLQRVSRMGADQPSDAFPLVVAVATIAGSLQIDQIEDVVRDCQIDFTFAGESGIQKELRRAFLVRDDAVPPLEPDILGASFLLQVLSKQADRAAEVIWAGMKPNIQQGFERIGRLSYDAEVLLGTHDPQISKWLVQCVLGRTDRCSLLEPLLYDHLLPTQTNAAIAVWRTLLQACKEPRKRAELLVHLCTRLAESGNPQEALSSIKEAVRVYRRLCRRNPDVYEYPLAMALNNTSAWLHDTGDLKGALKISKQAVECYRQVTRRKSGRYDPDLARSLVTFAAHLQESGDLSEALQRIQEALVLLKGLAPDVRPAYEFEIAMALSNLSACFAMNHDLASAMKTSAEAVERLRRLCESSPGRYESYLAIALTNISGDLQETGDCGHALDAIQEAVDINRQLCKIHPNCHEPNLALSLSSLARCLMLNGRRSEGVEALAEAVRIRHRLFTSCPTRHASGFARSLWDFGCLLAMSQLREQAAVAFEEGLEIIRPRATQWPNSPDAQIYRLLQMGLQHLKQGMGNAENQAPIDGDSCT